MASYPPSVVVNRVCTRHPNTSNDQTTRDLTTHTSEHGKRHVADERERACRLSSRQLESVEGSESVKRRLGLVAVTHSAGEEERVFAGRS